MLQRVVRNRFELSVSLSAGSVFKGGHDGISAGSEQAQTVQSLAEQVTFHPGADFASIRSLRDLPVEVPEKLIKIGSSRLESIRLDVRTSKK